MFGYYHATILYQIYNLICYQSQKKKNNNNNNNRTFIYITLLKIEFVCPLQWSPNLVRSNVKFMFYTIQ